MMFLIKLYAFLKRDFLNAASYKYAFISSFLGIFLSSATFYFISKLITGNQVAALESYGGDYFSFVIVGVAFSGLLGLFQEGLPGIIRSAQMTGILESLLVTQTGIPTILVGSSLYSLIYMSIRMIFHIILAIVVFGMQLGNINWLGAMLVFLLTALCFLSIGILSASFIMVYKMGNPFNWLFGSVSGLLGGVFFPIAVLPDWLRLVSYALPITYSLEGMRKSLLTSAGFSEILPSILALAGFGGLLFPLSLLVFRRAVVKAKRDGTLTHY
jgi:ABC-2 type transport system permease protein